ncbi:MmgE/PrpD family protein [Paraburkholderia fungorum]|uniref:MmgE/PrpD family protein n=1 Tax=Paraburkholderia fungorum TaxID=134537 RepID=UPI0038B77D4A
MSTEHASLLPGATRTLAEFSSRIEYDDLPADVVERMKLSVLDSLGCILHGNSLPWTERVLDMVRVEGGMAVASVFGTDVRTSVSQAVLVNATGGHAFELDDIHKESIVHPGSIAVPVALALSEGRREMSGRELIAAIVAGYEIGTRVGNAATMSLFYRGFHPQGSSGVFVAAAAAARSLRLDAERTHHALGIVGSQAGGLMAAQEGAMVKRLHSGRAAQSGVYAALLAERGFTGISDVLEAGYGGYLSTYSGEPKPQRLTDGLGSEWETGKIGYKPHACVTSIHTALDSLATLMREHALSVDDIESVDVALSNMTYVHCAWEYKAQGVTAAQMNLFYGLAVIAVDGVAFVEQYRLERLRDPRLFDFIGRVTARIDPQIDAMGPAFRHAARVTIRTRDGRTLHHEILNRRGSPENPLGYEDIEYKFRQVSASVLSRKQADRLVQLVAQLERLDDLRELISILGTPRP